MRTASNRLSKWLRWPAEAALTLALGLAAAAALVRCAPGFGADERALDHRLSQAAAESLRQPPQESYWSTLARLARLDFGMAQVGEMPVGELLAARLPITALTAGAGALLGWLLAVTLGCLAASGSAGILLRWSATVLSTLPPAVLALAALLKSAGPSPAALAAAVVALAVAPRLLLNVLQLIEAQRRTHYLRLAQARGVHGLGLILRHLALPLFPLWLALLANAFSLGLAAAVPVEVICGAPGLGQLAWLGAQQRDINLVAAVALAMLAANYLLSSTAACFAEHGDRR